MNTPYDIDGDYDNNDDPSPFIESDITHEQAIEELEAEGYSRDEAERMLGEYDPDEYYGFDDDIDRDVPDFIDDGDFE